MSNTKLAGRPRPGGEPHGLMGSPVVRSVLGGVAVVTGTVLAGSLAVTAGLGWVAIPVVVLCALSMILVMRTKVVVGLTGVVIAVACGIFALQQEAPPFGSEVRGIGVAEASGSRAAYFYFNDGKVLADRAETVTVRGGSGFSIQTDTEYHPYQVAPLVGSSWRAGETPVPAWVITLSNQPRAQAQWSLPLRAAVRINTTDGAEIAAAMRAAERRGRFTALDHAPLLRWVADPVAAQIGEWRRLGAIAGIGLVAWLAVLLADALIGAGRQRRS